MAALHHHQVPRAAERYLRMFCRGFPGAIDARRLSARLHARLPQDEAAHVTSDELLQTIMERAIRLGHDVRW